MEINGYFVVTVLRLLRKPLRAYPSLQPARYYTDPDYFFLRWKEIQESRERERKQKKRGKKKKDKVGAQGTRSVRQVAVRRYNQDGELIVEETPSKVSAC